MVLALLCFGRLVYGNEVSILGASFRLSGSGAWDVSVTLRHEDAGWDHYADAWRIVSGDGAVLGTRTLYHPHENEQPFTRSLSGIAIPPATRVVFVEAHDKVHGWSTQRLRVDLARAEAGRLDVKP
ncbi:MAG: hypothetical protein KDK91_19735 [Gammaproteobacteria bacterium]|nr:hypothetical protein [Gammaproteobacteria bacterium]